MSLIYTGVFQCKVTPHLYCSDNNKLFISLPDGKMEFTERESCMNDSGKMEFIERESSINDSSFCRKQIVWPPRPRHGSAFIDFAFFFHCPLALNHYPSFLCSKAWSMVCLPLILFGKIDSYLTQ